MTREEREQLYKSLRALLGVEEQRYADVSKETYYKAKETY